MVRWIEDNEPSERFPLWTRANVGEVLPEPPTPLGWDLVWENGTLPGWRDCAVKRIGVNPHELSEVRPEVCGLFGGYGYLNATAVRLFGHRAPDMTAEEIDAAYFGDHPDVPPWVPEPWHEDEAQTAKVGEWMGWVMTTTEQPELEADREFAERVRAERPDYSSMSLDELLAFVDELVPSFRRMFEQHIHQSAAASIGPGVIGAVAEAVGDPTLTLKIIGAVGDVDSAAPSYAMWELSRQVRTSDALGAAFAEGVDGLDARLRAGGDEDVAAFVADLDDFLARFGSRGPNEWDIHAHTWETNPDLVLAMVDRMRLSGDDESPVSSHAQREAERAAIVQHVTEALAGDPEAQGQFQAGVASAARFVPGRERSKTSIIKVIHEARMATWEIGRRLVAAGAIDEPRAVAMLFRDELQRALDDADFARDTIAARYEHWHHLRTIEPLFLINGTPPPADSWPRKADASFTALGDGEVLQGVPGSSGSYRGTARVVLDPSDPTVLGPGDILIAPHTDPAWTPLFVPAGAVVVDVGAALSHAIIVSRELGLPCVVSATSATRRIPDGSEIEVNGDTGTVTVVSVPV